MYHIHRCITYTDVSHTPMYRIHRCIAYTDVSHTPMYHIHRCITYTDESVSHTPIGLQVTTCHIAIKLVTLSQCFQDACRSNLFHRSCLSDFALRTGICTLGPFQRLPIHVNLRVQSSLTSTRHMPKYRAKQNLLVFPFSIFDIPKEGACFSRKNESESVCVCSKPTYIPMFGMLILT